MSIDGLASGLNTTALVEQLMQLERQPQLRLQAARQLNQSAIDALKGLNGRFASLKTAATALTTSTGWQPAKASSTNEAVAAVTASAGAKPASLTFEVKQLASAGSAISAGTVTSLDTVVASGTSIVVDKGTDSRTITVGDGTLSSVIDAVNAEKMGVTASAVQVAPGEFRLQLTSTTTGAGTGVSVAAGAFTADTLGDLAELGVPRDAVLEVGGTNPYTITRPSNTMSDVLTGVTLTVRALGTTTVAVETDPAAVVASVKKLVDQTNSILADIKSKTTYDTVNKRGSALTGDGLARTLQTRLLSTFSAGVTVDGATRGVAELGITVERDGTIKLDETKLLEAFEDDPALVQAVVGGGDGLSGRLEALATTVTAPSTSTTDVGLLTGAIASRERQRTQLDSDIKAWDGRLELRRTALVRQFTALETALAQAQSQGQWLSGQLAGLQANQNS